MAPSKARAQQQGSNGEDDQLTLQARARRPKVRHWWGVRKWRTADDAYDPNELVAPDPAVTGIVQRQGAWCYVCEKPIATWSSRWPMTEQAKAAVELHRLQHIQGRLDFPPQVEEKR